VVIPPTLLRDRVFLVSTLINLKTVVVSTVKLMPLMSIGGLLHFLLHDSEHVKSIKSSASHVRNGYQSSCVLRPCTRIVLGGARPSAVRHGSHSTVVTLSCNYESLLLISFSGGGSGTLSDVGWITIRERYLILKDFSNDFKLLRGHVYGLSLSRLHERSTTSLLELPGHAIIVFVTIL
jgi:hypothetical protein